MVLKLKRHHRKGFSIFSIQNFMRLIFSAIAFSPSFSLNLKLDPTDKTLSWESNTLGTRGFSCAVFGFRQVLKSDPREKLFLFSCLRSLAEDVSACGRRGSSSQARKNLWYQGQGVQGNYSQTLLIQKLKVPKKVSVLTGCPYQAGHDFKVKKHILFEQNTKVIKQGTSIVKLNISHLDKAVIPRVKLTETLKNHSTIYITLSKPFSV